MREKIKIAYYTIVDRPCPRHGLVAVGLRCAHCGHRLGHWEGRLWVPPIETRRQPWRIPAEIVGRYRAMTAATRS